MEDILTILCDAMSSKMRISTEVPVYVYIYIYIYLFVYL